jgi:hypothetical protein
VLGSPDCLCWLDSSVPSLFPFLLLSFFVFALPFLLLFLVRRAPTPFLSSFSRFVILLERCLTRIAFAASSSVSRSSPLPLQSSSVHYAFLHFLLSFSSSSSAFDLEMRSTPNPTLWDCFSDFVTMSALMDAIRNGDIAKVEGVVVEGANTAERSINGYTAFLQAAYYGHIPIIHWLLTEGASSLAEYATNTSTHALMVANMERRFPIMQYLLEERGSLVSERDWFGRTVWGSIYLRGYSSIELYSLLKVMVILEDAPAGFIVRLSTKHAEICTRGRQLRGELPCRHTWSNRLSGPRSLRTALCLLCCNLLSLRTPRPPRRTCGQTGYACTFRCPREPVQEGLKEDKKERDRRTRAGVT